jgi:hypothetical protein
MGPNLEGLAGLLYLQTLSLGLNKSKMHTRYRDLRLWRFYGYIHIPAIAA